MDVSVEDIKLYNPQMSGITFTVPKTKRMYFPTAMDLVDKPSAIAIVGLRRVGKTILVKQVLNELLDQGRDVFYFSFDEDRYATVESLDQVIRFALDLYDRPVIALDEIGRITNWAGVIKKYIDSKGVKFILSGSRSLDVSKGKESLAGRLFDIYLPPLQFIEFASFQGKRIEPLALDLNDPLGPLVIWKRTGLLDEFLLKGGFPEIIAEKNRDFIRRYVLSNCIEKIIFEDLKKTFGITNEHALFTLWDLIARNPSMTFVAINLESTVGLSRDTINKYLFYLETASLVGSVYRHGSVQSRMRKGRKVYPITPCISSLVAADEISSGQIAETAVFDKLVNGLGKEVHFHRDRRGLEIDFILNGIPIEVKFRKHISEDDTNNSIKFLKKRKGNIALLITRDRLDIIDKDGVRIVLVPLELFLSLADIKQTE